MPRLTYRAQTPSDPSSTTVGPFRFEDGEAVNVDQATYDRLSTNPWFTGGKSAREEAEGLQAGRRGGAREDSSVNVAYPPGSGAKYPGADYVTTSDGLVPAGEASLVDGANTTDDEGEEPKRRGRPPKNG